MKCIFVVYFFFTSSYTTETQLCENLFPLKEYFGNNFIFMHIGVSIAKMD